MMSIPNRQQQTRTRQRTITIRPKNYRVGICTRICHILTFVPFAILGFERLYIPLEYDNLGSYLDVEHTAITTTVKNDPNMGKSETVMRRTRIPTLSKLTASFSWKTMCTEKATPHLVTNVELTKDTEVVRNDIVGKIPKLIHQTGKRRCLTRNFDQMTSQWKSRFQGYSYYFHDDDALNRLLDMEFPEFPHLRTILRNCVTNGTLKSDLWRYLVLWVYGGVYADLDSIPNELTIDTIRPEYDAMFVVEQYHVLSQWFMAVSPRHPIMFYAIQHSLLNLLEAEDTQRIGAHVKTGPHALHKAFMDFRNDIGELVEPLGAGFKPVWQGEFEGTGNRTITVLGVGENENQYVQRSAISPVDRKRDYAAIGMTHFSTFTKPSSKASGKTCADAILDDITLAFRQQRQGAYYSLRGSG